MRQAARSRSDPVGVLIDHTPDPAQDDYRYRPQVNLGPHRLMLRPRESRDLRLISSEVKIKPTATLTYSQDVFGNSVTAAVFGSSADMLVIDSVTQLQLAAGPRPVFDIAASAILSFSIRRRRADPYRCVDVPARSRSGGTVAQPDMADRLDGANPFQTILATLA